jgi:hypothetical protein
MRLLLDGQFAARSTCLWAVSPRGVTVNVIVPVAGSVAGM